MGNNLTTIKSRILELVKAKGFKVSKFFEEIGDNYENFKGKKLEAIPNAEILVKIRTKIPDANIDWILTGDGEMTTHKVEKSCAFTEKILEKISTHFETLGNSIEKVVEQNGEVIKQHYEIVRINADVVKQNAEVVKMHAEAMQMNQTLIERLR